ncbi:hypothetical protein FC84_GL001078 [Lapidilactobacillus dextrinicus DSM 20335]|uniref:Uncharacterized protein n=1 Tax=Lapidilactobacillus dextrinicus DSM 20335 TaxID=1423738 RepID=A0A0R2BTB7_9LACO|nr:hypothetical protein [Lapidilactobacillus dextrinicus]KRM79609.1 hypothetical protein FC84_GL001078 [Lapidilactobacillus dextrinicus DSM 20335]QFG47399.1 hypothetical protein LH506_08205 [Lapidilactobacillus dextrinicus]
MSTAYSKKITVNIKNYGAIQDKIINKADHIYNFLYRNNHGLKYTSAVQTSDQTCYIRRRLFNGKVGILELKIKY